MFCRLVLCSGSTACVFYILLPLVTFPQGEATAMTTEEEKVSPSGEGCARSHQPENPGKKVTQVSLLSHPLNREAGENIDQKQGASGCDWTKFPSLSFYTGQVSPLPLEPAGSSSGLPVGGARVKGGWSLTTGYP